MDVNLEVVSGEDLDPGVGNGLVTDETLIGKIGGFGEEEAGAKDSENAVVEVVGSDGIGKGEEGGEAAEIGGEVGNSGEQESAAVESVVQGKIGDVGEGDAGVKSCVDVNMKSAVVVDDYSLEDMDVDIDDSGHVQTGRGADETVDTATGEVGNGIGTVEDTAKARETSEDVGKMEHVRGDEAHPSEELVNGKSGGGTVGNTVGESEDEEVDIGGHEPNLFTNTQLATDENVRSEETEVVLHASYQLPEVEEREFSVSDMVWGKVRSHPWWPGQIFDPSDSSEIAMKHHKKDCYLVAFFGDRTFAWSEASQLKHFRAHFSHVEKQGALHHAISCALEEVSRRFELGLACHCIQTDVYEKLRYQLVENTGIKEESSRRESTDESASAYSFEPCNFLQYIKSVAQSPSLGADELELVIAKAQLLAFNRLKGYNHLPEYQFTEWSLNNELESVDDQSDYLLKRKHNMRNIVYSSKRERSMAELMDESMLLMGEDYEDEETLHSSSTSLLSNKKQNAGNAPKQSFKIGDCIVRAASQMTGSPGPSSFLKSINEKYQKVNESNGARLDVPLQHENPNVNSSSSVADDMLLPIQSVENDSKKEQGSISNSTNIISAVRNSTPSADKAVDVRTIKASRSVKGSPETFEFEDMKDSYWTDRVIQNGGEENSEHKERKLNYQAVSLEPPASVSRGPRVHSRKRYSNGDHKIAADRPMSAIDKSKQDKLPAELILNFPDINSVPSESKLNNMFRRFGPLKEFETEVDRESNRARVVFKRSSDAEIAYSSCQKFNIFGSTFVRYELSYTPSVSYKAARIPATQGMETVTLPELDFTSSTHDLEFITMQELEDATMQDLHYTHPHDLEGVTMQDLEFTTTHDLEFPVSHEMAIESAHVSEIETSQSLDVPAQDQHPGASELPSSGDMELQVVENVIDGSGTAPQDMEISTAGNQQQTNQTPNELESVRVQDSEGATVQYVEQVPNPDVGGGINGVETNGSVAMEVSAQDTDNSVGQGTIISHVEDQDTEITATQDAEAITTGEEKSLKNDDSDSADKHANIDGTGLQVPEVDTNDPMILSDHGAEQGTDVENDTIVGNQSADQEINLENDTVAAQEIHVVAEAVAPVGAESPAPDDAKEHEHVESEAAEDFEAAASTKNETTTALATNENETTNDDAAGVGQDTSLKTTEQKVNLEEQVLPDNVEMESEAADPSIASSVDMQNDVDVDVDGVAAEANEKGVRSHDSKEEEWRALDSSTGEDRQEAT